ncbi:synaptonemal complex protein 1 [Galleria mellonella]|uniref:Synaptonemal complex protein 1 n=1 Tax=Galleria mellonella TaxID=7137 RepID=A0A6J1X978_GALME|nr:synaptonemal complex protein 1 [Galleria mellonella]
MATCYQKHPFEIEKEDRLTTINTKIFEIKKKIQLSEGQRKSCYEENEQEKQQNNDLIETLKKEIKLRLNELAQAKTIIGEEEVQVKKYLNEICPTGNKSSDQIIHNLDLKVIEQRKLLDLLKYEKRNKKNKLRQFEKDYEHLLIESTKSELVKSKTSTRARKHMSHLENEIHKVIIQWTEAELVKKKYFTIRQALIDDSVKFESSLTRIEEALNKQKEEIAKLEKIREDAAEMRIRATAATSVEAARAQDAEHEREAERAYFAQRFAERKRELERLEKRIFPPQARVVRQESVGSTDGEVVTEEATAAAQMEAVFQRLMKLTGVNEAEEVFERFQAQRETCKRLNYLQQTTEEEKLELESAQTSLLTELEAFKFASVKDKDEGQEQIGELKEEIIREDEKYAEIEKQNDDINTLLLEIKRLLYDLCKILDVVPDPVLPEWTAEARDVQELVSVLAIRYEKAKIRAEEIRNKQGDTTIIAVPSNPASRPSSVAGGSVQSHSTHKESERVTAVPTYKELVQKEPVKGGPSDEEEDIPSRCYLKRQAQLIVDTKCRRKGFRAFPRK